MVLPEFSFCVFSSLVLSKVNFLVGLFWQNINQFTNWSAEFLVQWSLSLLSYCLFGDMLAWLENKARIWEIVLIGFLLILIAIYLDDWLGIYECFKPCKKTETFQFGYRKYNGPSVWKEHYESALGQRQSPINILLNEAVICRCGPLQWELYSDVPESMVMYNDGYSVTLHGNWKCGRPKLTGAPLGDEKYVFNRLYFHWGPTDSEGSEHTLDYERFPLELHMVFLKEGYNNLMDAHYSQCPNGIVIVAFLFEITPVDNPGFLNSVTDNLHKVKTPKSGCCVEPFALNDIYPEFEYNYYKYDGSITQPPCSEIVTYIIQSETVAVSKRQVIFYDVLKECHGSGNCWLSTASQWLTTPDLFRSLTAGRFTISPADTVLVSQGKNFQNLVMKRLTLLGDEKDWERIEL